MGDLSQFKPTPAREKTWQSQTRTPFDPLEAAAAIGSRTVECPECLAGVESRKRTRAVQLFICLTPDASTRSAFLTDAGTGYAQPAFTVVCEQCKFVITKEKLGVAKLVRDVVRDREVGHGAYLACVSALDSRVCSPLTSAQRHTPHPNERRGHAPRQ